MSFLHINHYSLGRGYHFPRIKTKSQQSKKKLDREPSYAQEQPRGSLLMVTNPQEPNL